PDQPVSLTDDSGFRYEAASKSCFVVERRAARTETGFHIGCRPTAGTVSAPGARLGGEVGSRLSEHGLAGRDLHPLAPLGLTEGLLRGLEPVVALPISVFDALGLEQLDDRIRVLIHGAGQRPRRLVVEDVADRLQRVPLRVADQTHRAALDPPGGVYTGDDVRLGGPVL